MKTYERLDDIGFSYAIRQGERLMDVLTGLEMSESHKSAKNLVRSSGVKVNDECVKDPGYMFKRGGHIVSVGNGRGLVGMSAKRYRVVAK